MPNAKFKSANDVIALLVEVTAKGGSLLLGVGPTPTGIIEPEVERILREIGGWLKVNGEGIYNTRITPVYHAGNVWFSASKDGSKLYAHYIPSKDTDMPDTIEWENNIPAKNSSVLLLKTGEKLKWSRNGNKIKVNLSRKAKQLNEPLVFVFNIEKK